MRLLRVHIIEASTCGGLLDGIDFNFRNPLGLSNDFDPMCLIGSNGSGKSQFLQLLAEIFLTAWHTFSPQEEAADANPTVLFELEYMVRSEENEPMRVRLKRDRKVNRITPVTMQLLMGMVWTPVASKDATDLLPSLLVGYTSGGNETLSLPFAVSRMEYAERVGKQARNNPESDRVPDTRLMLLDYTTHLEVLVASLLLGAPALTEALLAEPKLHGLRSFRCIIQLKHTAGPTGGVQLTTELEQHIVNLQKCATCWDYQEDHRTYILDFLVDESTKIGFRHFWNNSLNLYRSLHKLAMLNDLALPNYVQNTFRRDVANRRFATRMPEPPDLDKVFRFDRVTFIKRPDSKAVVDYVSLSDGEHQLVQVLGILGMIAQRNAFFIFDEPESHFNPQWRVKFVQKIRDVPTLDGPRATSLGPASQELLLTTHAPFVPSDMSRDNVLVFSKIEEDRRIEIRRPDIETFGTTFDRILEHCFAVSPPISIIAQAEIDRLLKSFDEDEIEAGMVRLGASVEKTYLAHRLRELRKAGGAG